VLPINESHKDTNGESVGNSNGDAIDGSVGESNGGARRPRRWLAVILGLFLPGLGYFYMGRTRLAVAAALVIPVLPMVLLGVGILGTPAGVLIFLAMLVAFVAGPAIHVVRMRRWTRPPRTRGQSILRYVAFLALVFTSQFLLSDWVKERALRTCVRVMKNSGQSMLPTLLPEDRIVVNTCRPVTVRAGHLAMIARPDKPTALMIKRVVGTGGDTVQITETSVLVNNRVFMTLESPVSRTMTYGPVTLEPDTFFVIGDYLANSADSRHFGAVPATHMLGYASYVLISPIGGIGRTFESLTPQ
jgi:signal peptidase I